MSRRSRLGWRWQRWISRGAETLWLARLEASLDINWLVIDKPARVRLSVEAYFSTRASAEALVADWGGSVHRVTEVWAPQNPGMPIRVSAGLTIVHETRRRCLAPAQLCIPYGIAFGSGEHATTLMLLRVLAAERDWARTTLLDLGTGSGVLALAARKLGARDIVATDFDPEAIRTARQNEKLNFRSARVRWECADVKRLRSHRSYSLIIANLFSGILIDAAPRIIRALRANGELWISGILRAQQEEVARAYRNGGLQLKKFTTRGKWVMQRWVKGMSSPNDNV